MLYMIIESFKNGDPVPVYRRFRDQGRLAAEALKYVSSWVTSDMTKCGRASCVTAVVWVGLTPQYSGPSTSPDKVDTST
jgi:negative regulator of sigma E activity